MQMVTGVYGHQMRPHIMAYMSIVFLKFARFFLRDMEEERKERDKKERKFGHSRVSETALYEQSRKLDSEQVRKG